MVEFLETIGVKQLNETEMRMLSPVKMAYLGDAVYEMYIRTYLINNFKGKVNKLNTLAVSLVRAESQALAAKELKEFLTDEEWRLLKRGRNQKLNVPSNVDVSDYKYSTGFEALIGYLHLKNHKERIFDIIDQSIKIISNGEINE